LKKVFNQENLEIKRKRDPNGYGNGDLLVHVKTPKTLNKDQKTIFLKNMTDENFVPNPENR
jgi:molecular chaperone DnaJ